MNTYYKSIISTSVFAVSLAAIAAPARAEYITSVGMCDGTVGKGGAAVATADDTDAFYVNPAGAAQFDRPQIGVCARAIDTRDLKFRDSTFSHPVEKTNTRGEIAVAPTIAGYLPVGDRVTVGLGFGAPFAISGKWNEDGGIHRYNMVDQSLFVVDLSPTVAVKLSDSVSVGAAVNINAFRELRTSSLFGPAWGGAPGAKITLQTDKDFWLPVPPYQFDPSFKDIGFTVGAQIRPMPGLALGVSYRSEETITFEGDVTATITGVPLTDRFSLKMEMPARLQAGFAFDMMPGMLRLSADIQRDFWSDAAGWNSSPAVVKFKNGTLLGLQGLSVTYDAHDTTVVRVGAELKFHPKVTLLLGYVNDPTPFRNDRVDILTYSSDRGIGTIGLKFDLTDPKTRKGTILTVSSQYIGYANRTIEPGESLNLGGISSPNISASGVVGFVPNTDRFTFGGHIWTLGVGATHRF